MSAPELLADLISRGVQLWRDGDLLRYRAPTSMAAGLPALLKAHKAELLPALAARTFAEPRTAPTPNSGIPPLEHLSPAEAEKLVEHIEERAAILEYDAGMARADAEAQARGAACPCRYPYYFTLAESPGQTPVIVCNLVTAPARAPSPSARRVSLWASLSAPRGSVASALPCRARAFSLNRQSSECIEGMRSRGRAKGGTASRPRAARDAIPQSRTRGRGAGDAGMTATLGFEEFCACVRARRCPRYQLEPAPDWMN